MLPRSPRCHRGAQYLIGYALYLPNTPANKRRMQKTGALPVDQARIVAHGLIGFFHCQAHFSRIRGIAFALVQNFTHLRQGKNRFCPHVEAGWRFESVAVNDLEGQLQWRSGQRLL